jgi:hypothetical protein
MSMFIRYFTATLFVFVSSVFGAGNGFANAALFKSAINDSLPYPTIAVHNIGKIAMSISNYGVIGRNSYNAIADPLTGLPAPSLSYPKGYNLNYLSRGGYWIGGIKGRDTLVSTGTEFTNEFMPTYYPEGDIQYRSTKDPDAPEFRDAVSQQDFIAVFADTLSDPFYNGYDYFSGRIHLPLGVKITQRSYAWGYDYAEDFVIFDCELVNMGFNHLKDMYIGLFMDNDCGRENNYSGSMDDICGFRKSVQSHYIPGLIDTINVAWAADNDGDPDVVGNFHGDYSTTSAIATRILRAPTDSITYSFNWWVSNTYNIEDDWGPRRAGTIDDPFRSFDGYMGTPVRDEDKYYMMSHREIDYDSRDTRNDHTEQGWLPPPDRAANIAAGADIRYLLSFGPFDLNVGDVVPFTFAIVGGQGFYAQPRSGPRTSYDFSDLAMNALWAGWIYDNPGVDTDGDGYKGKYHIYCRKSVLDRIDTTYYPTDTIIDTVYVCLVGDTIYYQGDGVPDFKGASPPPSPKVRLYPKLNEYNEGEITVRWNGRLSETTPDQFSQVIDFEGYRVYISITGKAYDYTLVSSYDIVNFDRYEYDPILKIWEILNQPYTLDRLHTLYGNDFDPLNYYDSDHLYPVYNSQTKQYNSYYFARHDWNQSDYTDSTKIHKIYPDAPYPSTLNMDSARMFYPNEVTEEGELKYFEYEYNLTNLLPSQQYYIAVSAFDQGTPAKQLRPMETDPTLNAQREYAQNSSAFVEEKDLKVVVYPNPYRIDANYRDRFEGWENPDLPAERSRAIHFTNLPHKCTIRIFTLDGDLVREIKHDYAKGAAGSMHEVWDMISRNTMTITSGIYYYSVDSELGNQIGKLVIIK